MPDGARLTQLAWGVYAFIGAGGDSNAGAILTSEGLLVIDAQQHATLGRQFRRALARETGKPVEWLIFTHYHLDHTGGSPVFAEEAPVLAQERTRDKLCAILGPGKENPRNVTDFDTKIRLLFGPNIGSLIPPNDPGWAWFKKRIASPEYETVSVALPTRTFTQRHTLDLPGRTVVLEYVGPAHCEGNIIVFLPENRIVFVADLFFVGRFPWLGDGDIEGWIRALDWVAELEVEQVVPGHGPPVTLKEVGEFRDMLFALHEAVAEAAASGIDEDQAAATVRLPAYESLPRYREWMPWNVRNLFRALGAE